MVKKVLFATVNNGLLIIRQWFIVERLTLNAETAKYTFHKNSAKDDILLKLQEI